MATKHRAAKPRSRKEDDVALICAVSPDGDGVHVLRRRNNRIEAGVAHALREGEPIHGEVVKLTPRKNFPLLCDVEVQLASPEHAAPSDVPSNRETTGPAQVASDSYRRNWDAIWKRPTNTKRLPN
ncbi:MAG TPA: hypothetical protein VL137_08640 [Polyangiaceae bacterium]|nr:hypothetical protein [Polyangiaceae bacterium]